MNRLYSAIALLFTAVAGLFATGASVARECDVILCTSPNFIAAWPVGSGPPSCDYPPSCSQPSAPSGLVAHRFLYSEPPSPAFVNCEGTGGGYFCEAWPQYSGLTYEWIVDGGMSIPYMTDPANPFVHLNCWGGMSGSIAVTVRSPFGVGATSSTRNLPACGF